MLDSEKAEKHKVDEQRLAKGVVLPMSIDSETTMSPTKAIA
jgi:hypothetical protein